MACPQAGQSRGRLRSALGSSASKAPHCGQSKSYKGIECSLRVRPKRGRRTKKAAATRQVYLFHLEVGTSGLFTEITGPSALGMMSKSNISVGIHRVAQTLGTSTMPLICPCTGAVPSNE